MRDPPWCSVGAGQFESGRGKKKDRMTEWPKVTVSNTVGLCPRGFKSLSCLWQRGRVDQGERLERAWARTRAGSNPVVVKKKNSVTERPKVTEC